LVQKFLDEPLRKNHLLQKRGKKYVDFFNAGAKIREIFGKRRMENGKNEIKRCN